MLAIASRDGGLSCRNRSLCLRHPKKDCFGETPKVRARTGVSRQTRALPGKNYPPSWLVISGSFFRRKRNQLFHVLRMLSRGVR